MMSGCRSRRRWRIRRALPSCTRTILSESMPTSRIACQIAKKAGRDGGRLPPSPGPWFEWRGLPFVAWLLAIAAKVLSDRWQRSAKQQEVSTDDLELTGIEDNVEQRAMLYQLVQTLPDDQRRGIIWRFVESVRPNV